MLMDDSDTPQPQARITSRLIDSLYTEAMLLADEARSYFDDAGRDERNEADAELETIGLGLTVLGEKHLHALGTGEAAGDWRPAEARAAGDDHHNRTLRQWRPQCFAAE